MIRKSVKQIVVPFVPVFNNDLIPADAVPGALQVAGDDDFDDLAGGGGFLPRLQLCTSNSNLCKDATVPINNYAVIAGSDDPEILGATADVIVVAWRPKALDMSDDENIIAIHDKDEAEFTRIKDASFEQDSGCMFGPEFLVYIPELEKFATLFFGSKTARREAPQMKKRLRQAATCKSRLIETKAYKWQAMVITDCTTPVDGPDAEKLAEAVEQFNNPSKPDVEVAEVAGEEERPQ